MNRIISWFAPCLFALLLLGSAAAVPAAGTAPSATSSAAQSASAEPPQAVAGLDQTVERNASVLLDATQSFSPEGELVAYDWTITSPSGASVDQTCDSTACGLAHFRAPDLGEYTVTVTVTDDEGQEASDTLYVTVVPRGDFGVELSGPTDASGGDEANLTATISPGASVVENVTWYRGDQAIGNQSVPELGGVFNHSALIVPGATYRAVVADQWNQTVSDTWNASGSAGSWTPGTPGTDEYPRIEGPAVVTGSPDMTAVDGTWEYTDVNYVVRTSEHGTVTKSLWGLDNGDSVDFNHDGTQVDVTLRPGVNTVSANLDLELEQLGEFAQNGGENATAYNRVNSTVSAETVLNRHVIVDPAPEFEYLNVYANEDSIAATGRFTDPYNPPTLMEVSVGGNIIKQKDLTGGSGAISTRVSVDGEYGETSVTVRIEDGREQTAVEATSVSLPPSPSASTTSDSQESQPSMMSTEKSSMAGNSPSSSKLSNHTNLYAWTPPSDEDT